MIYDGNIIIEGFVENIKEEYGIEIEPKNVHWRGFGSQGDGLCFDFAIIVGTQALNFLKKIKARYIELISEDLVDSLVDIEIFTTQNQFANLYCHENTRNITVDIDYNATELKKKDAKLYEFLKDTNTLKDIEEDVKNWYNSKCIEVYKEIENHYFEIQHTIDEEQEDMTFSDRIDALIDPEMDIDKVIEMIQDAKSLSYTKSEAYALIEKFRENFKKEYLIIKKL